MKGENLTVLEQNTQLTHRLRSRGCPHNLIAKNYLGGFICWTEVGFTTKQLSVKKKFYLLFSYKVAPPLHHPKNNFMSKSSLHREKYTKRQRLSPRFSSGAKIFGHVYHTLPSLYVCVWLVNTFTPTAPIGSPIICVWSPADICVYGKDIYLSVQQTLVRQERVTNPLRGRLIPGQLRRLDQIYT